MNGARRENCHILKIYLPQPTQKPTPLERGNLVMKSKLISSQTVEGIGKGFNNLAGGLGLRRLPRIE